jgi:hypothetical protein
MTRRTAIELAPDVDLPDRPFTALARTADDLATLGRMLARQRRLVAEAEASADDRRDEHLTDAEDGGIHHIVLPSLAAARAAGDMATVGFFGQARLEVDHEPIVELEHALIASMTPADGVIAYHNVFWPGTGWGNLVVFRDQASRSGWGHDPRHGDAVGRSPRHYHSIRLHIGALPGGIAADGAIELLRTRYLDMEEEPVWRAIRPVRPGTGPA